MQNKSQYIFSELAFVMIRIILSVGDDDMVHEEYAHDIASLLYLSSEHIVVLTWL